jgi:hypothetical protein
MIIFRHPGRKVFRSVWLILPLLSACGAPRCQPGAGQALLVYNLYFGRSVAGRAEVSDREWREFRDQVITPALPNGYTLLDGQGAWLNPRLRTTISENTKILVVALPDAPESLSTINRLRSVWRQRFHQYVVGMTVQTGCGSFSPAEASP